MLITPSFKNSLIVEQFQGNYLNAFNLYHQHPHAVCNCLLFLVLSVTISKPQQMMSSSANYRPFLSSFRHIPPQESFVKLANKLIMKKMAENGRNVYLVKIGLKTSGHMQG